MADNSMWHTFARVVPDITVAEAQNYDASEVS